jgi:predicted lipoprotein with Yx(FWY)xxD motif
MQLMGYRSVVSLKTGIKGWNDYDQPLYDANENEMDGDDAWEKLNVELRDDQKSSE